MSKTLCQENRENSAKRTNLLKEMTSEEKIETSVLRYLRKIDDKVERLEKLIRKLGCYDENNRPKKKPSDYNRFVKAHWHHEAFKNLDSLSRMSAIAICWKNRQPKKPKTTR